MSTTEIVIIGGGVMGTSIAWQLAQKGAKVTLLERDQLAAQASGATAGGVRQLGRDARELPLAIASIARWQTLEDELEADVEFRRGGQLLVTEDPALIPELEQRVADEQARGLSIRLVQGDDFHAIAKGFAPGIEAGITTDNDGQASGKRTTRAFGAAAERAGATIKTGVTVTGLVQSDGRVTGVETAEGTIAADLVILAAGAWSRRLAETIGVRLPLSTMGLQMMATGPAEPMLAQTVGALNRHLSLKQTPDGRFVIGGGWPGDFNLDTATSSSRMSSIRGSIEHASAVYPVLGALPLDRVWVGIEALCYDEVPIIGPVAGLDGLIIATGFSGHGFALSPIIGQLVSELIVDGAPSISLDAFALSRFDGLRENLEFPDHQAG
ncbi:MAG: FAD-binding oxidoreductase [Thermomicrobiales bacterium]|nr:FAD-binding oxidoreductase [Thermomicrobiales bacterium]